MPSPRDPASLGVSKCLVCGKPDGERAYCIYFDGEGLCRECCGWAMAMVIGWWREYGKVEAEGEYEK